MTISKIIKKEDVASLHIWDLPTVGKPGGRPPKRVVPMTAEQLEKMQNDAWKEGLELGRVEGIKEGRERGFQQGVTEGREKGKEQALEEKREELEQHSDSLQELMISLNEPLQELDELLADEVSILAIAIAKQVIRREIHHEPGQIIAVVREAIERLPLAGGVLKIWLHPDDMELIRTYLKVDKVERYQLIEDSALERGGCRLETDQSRIQATVERQIQAVVAQLFGSERKPLEDENGEDNSKTL